MKKTVLVAMSGGVDSSLTAALLKEDGYRVVGITMQLLPQSVAQDSKPGACCGTSSIRDAQRIAAELRIPHYVLNLRSQFKKHVIDNFAHEYMSGRTPNPCIRCNRFLKFGILLDRADELGAEYIATGHYSRIEREPDGTFRLKRAIDPRKDQSYFLYIMNQQHLKRTLMPLGYYTKNEVRRIARNMGLHVHEKPESQEICFIDGKNYRQFFERQYPDLLIPGPIINGEGSTIGMHSGIPGYTIGQRRGIGVSSSRPLYVTGIDRERNAIIVGERKEAYHNELIADDVNWIVHCTELFGPSFQPLPATVKVRSIHDPAEALIICDEEKRVRVLFRHPQWAVTPGQAAVFYDGEEVIGGGTIVRGRRIDQKNLKTATWEKTGISQNELTRIPYRPWGHMEESERQA